MLLCKECVILANLIFYDSGQILKVIKVFVAATCALVLFQVIDLDQVYWHAI